MRNNRKAEAGIGTLILFIAMILVAAVAAGVLIQTSSSLQSKAIDTGSQSREQVATSVVAVQMYVVDVSEPSDTSDRDYTHGFLKTKLAAGSGPIRLNDSIIQVDTYNARTSLQYNTSIDCTNETQVNASETSSQFGASYITGTNNDYIETGDVVELCFVTPEEVNESRPLRVSFVPKVGQALTLNVVSPQVMVDERETLYP